MEQRAYIGFYKFSVTVETMFRDKLIKAFAAVTLFGAMSIGIMLSVFLVYWLFIWVMLQIVLIADVIGSWFLFIVFLAFCYVVYLSYRYISFR